jgi:hypothetical protein
MERFTKEIHTTKYFGEVELFIDEDGSDADFNTTYKGQEIFVSFSKYDKYGDKMKLCWEIIDKYAEINEIAKKAIIENFPNKNGTVNYYFKYHFNKGMLGEKTLLNMFGVKEFKDLDIKTTVEKLDYPNLFFLIYRDEITFSATYMVSKFYTEEILCVKFDEELNVIGFSHDS